MNNDRSNKKVIPLDPPMTEKQLEEALDLFYKELESCKKIPAGEEVAPCQE